MENEALLAPAAQHLAVADEGTLLRRKTKIKWVFGYEKKFTQKVEALEFLTNKLYDLVPPLDIHPLGSHDASARQLGKNHHTILVYQLTMSRSGRCSLSSVR